MLDKKIYQLFWPKPILGVNWYVNQQGEEEIRYTNIGLSKSKLSLLGTPQSVVNFDQVDGAIKKLPIALTISGKGVLQKVVEATDADTDDYVLSEVLPNANIKEFYIQRNTIAENKQFVAVIRKSQIDLIIQKFANDGTQIIGVFLGLSALINISSFFSGYQSIEIEGYSIKLDSNGGVAAISKALEEKNENYKVGDEKIGADMLVAFSGAVNLLLKTQGELEIEQTEAAKSDLIYSVAAKQTGLYSGVAFLVILLINFLFFQHYYKQSDNLKSQATVYGQSFNQLKEIKSQYDSSRVFLSQAGWLKPNNASFYLDRLAEGVPNGMMLKQVNLYPRKANKITERNTYSFESQLMQVKGEIDKNSILTTWIETLTQLEWIASSKVIMLEQEQENKPGLFELELEIN